MEKQTFFRKCKATLSALNKFRIEKNITFSAMRARFFGFSKKFKENVPTAIQNMATDEVTDYFMSVKKIRYLRIAGVTSLFVLLILAMCLANPFTSHSDDAEATGSEEEVQINVDIPQRTASVKITPDTITGTFSTSEPSQKIVAEVSTNAIAGYTINLKGNSDNALIGRDSHQRIESISGATTREAFSEGQQYNNYYGITQDDSNYSPAPGTNGKIIGHTDGPNSAQDVDVYSIGIGARANNQTPSDIYEGTFNMEVAANFATYTIQYAYQNIGINRYAGLGNYLSINSDTIPSTQRGSISSSNYATILPDKTPKPSYSDGVAFRFAGWCLATENLFELGRLDHCFSNDATLYQYGDKIPLTSKNTNIYLYPVYDHNDEYAKIGIAFDDNAISRIEIRTEAGDGGWEASSAIYYDDSKPIVPGTNIYGGWSSDLQQGQTFYIRPILKFGYKFVNWEGDYPSLSSKTDPNPSFTVGTENGYIILNTASDTMQNFTNAAAAAMSEGDTKTLIDSRDDQEYTVAKFGSLVWMTKNLSIGSHLVLTPDDSNVTSNYTISWEEEHHSTDGNTNCTSDAPCYYYYSYAAATAGTNPSSGDATSDICPKGWRLPTYSETDELGRSLDEDLIEPPFLGALNGYYDSNQSLAFRQGGTYGYYWSSTTDGSSEADILTFGDHGYRSLIFSTYKTDLLGVRCVKPTTPGPAPSVATMQDFGSTAAAAMSQGESKTLADSRNNRKYTVTRIGDLVWMTRNLNLDGGITITSENSNVVSSYILPHSSANYFTTGVYNSDTTTCASSTPCYSYYSYEVATAGTNPSSGDATSDICPKGWRLPTYSETRELGISFENFTEPPFSGALNGSYQTSHSSFRMGGVNGNYWASSVEDASYAYNFVFNESGYNSLRESTDKTDGLGVRCVKSI